jgi:glutathione synthase
MIERILILVSEKGPISPGNHLLYTNALLRRGVHVSIGDINSVHSRQYVVRVNAVAISQPLSPGDRLDSLVSEAVPIADFDLAWVMDGRHPTLAADIHQLLWLAQLDTPFVNTVESILLMNNKNVLGAFIPPENLIPTNGDSSCADLWSILQASDHDWVLKPTNFGAGADVFLIRKADSNARALLQSATGNVEFQGARMEPSLLGLQPRFRILQRFEAGVQKGEKRVVFAGGTPFGQFLKLPPRGEHRPDMSYGGTRELCDLSPDEQALCATIGQTFMKHGIRFGGIDMAYPYVLEINIVNPAAALPILKMGGADISDRGIALLLESFETRAAPPAERSWSAAARSPGTSSEPGLCGGLVQHD